MSRRIAIIGGGIMGATTSLMLARSGFRTLLIDRAENIMEGASRWNEGKIHLGFLYAADPTLATARTLLPGAMSFKPIMESLLGEPLRHMTSGSDYFLVHEDSVCTFDETLSYCRSLMELIVSYPSQHYLQRLYPDMAEAVTTPELEEITHSEKILGAVSTPEMSINTQWLADRVVAAVNAENKVEVLTSTNVIGIKETSTGCRLRFSDGEAIEEEVFSTVINAGWESRLPIDIEQGLIPQPGWSHRYRVSVFANAPGIGDYPSAVICTGPFGDIKNYADGNLYLSWYADGLLWESGEITPSFRPSLSESDSATIETRMIDNLKPFFKVLDGFKDVVLESKLRGGWVFANGNGSLSDPASTLHRRDRIGVDSSGRYISIDTGKFSMAPYYAKKIVDKLSA